MEVGMAPKRRLDPDVIVKVSRKAASGLYIHLQDFTDPDQAYYWATKQLKVDEPTELRFVEVTTKTYLIQVTPSLLSPEEQEVQDRLKAQEARWAQLESMSTEALAQLNQANAGSF